MIALIQRVTHAEVRIGSRTSGAIQRGILALIGVARGDDQTAADRLLEDNTLHGAGTLTGKVVLTV